MITYEEEKDTVSKINYLVQHGIRIFQLIVTEDNDASYIPNFDFPYTLIDCKTTLNLTGWTSWGKILESDIPVIFINTSYMFRQFSEEYQELKVNGAALFAQWFYCAYRDRFWEEDRSKLIFMVTEKDVDEMWKYVNAGFTIELIPYYMRKSSKQMLKKNKEY